MKKSSVLMYAYVLVLFIVIILDYSLKQGITTRVAIAAAVASFFFSFAEMNELSAKRTEASLSIYKSLEASMNNIIVRIDDYVKKHSEKCVSLENRIGNYKEYSDAERIISVIQKTYSTMERMDKLAQDMKESKSEINHRIKGWERKRKSSIVFSRVFLFCGFFSFFIIALFDSISMRFASSQDAISIVAFAMVVFCYEFKDQSDEDYKMWQEKKKNSDEVEKQVLELTSEGLDLDLLNGEIDNLIAAHSPLSET